MKYCDFTTGAPCDGVPYADDEEARRRRPLLRPAGRPRYASAAPVDAIAGSGSGQGGGSGSSETQLICSPVAQLLFATGSVEKPALYDLLCLFS
ncbi:hypothetical protein ACWEQ0_10900 [Nocardia thailandica]